MSQKLTLQRTTRPKIHAGADRVVFNIVGYTLTGLMALLCVIPFWLLIVASFTEESAIYQYGYGFWPTRFSTEAYARVFNGTVNVFQAYEVSILITVAGTLLGMLIMFMAAYALQRKDFKYRNGFSFFFYFTTLFSGGMVAYYVMVTNYLHLTDTLWALLLPPLCTSWLIILLRSFISSIPESLTESAKIDGASDFRILFSIVFPLAKAGMATIGLFLALNYWNDWYNASLFINKREMWPLQYYLQNVIQNVNAMLQLSALGANVVTDTPPTESIKMATAVVATGPIILLYPFVQKYFVKGLTIGAVKG